MKPATQLQTCEGREISDIKTLSYFQTIISSSALNPIWGAGVSEVCETLQQGDSLFLPKGLCVFVFMYIQLSYYFSRLTKHLSSYFS